MAEKRGSRFKNNAKRQAAPRSPGGCCLVAGGGGWSYPAQVCLDRDDFDVGEFTKNVSLAHDWAGLSCQIQRQTGATDALKTQHTS